MNSVGDPAERGAARPGRIGDDEAPDSVPPSVRLAESPGREVPPHVLLVDDDDECRGRVAEALRAMGYVVDEVANGLDALKRFAACRPTIALLEVMTPFLDGFSICRAMRELPGGDEVSIVLMTDADDIESLQFGYDAGATDFVTKPINLVLLQHRIRYMIRAGQLTDQLRKSERKIATLAYRDALTGLPNRRSLERYITRLLRDIGTNGARGAIFLIDLDGFKRVNDTYGHSAGDELIRQVGRRVVGALAMTPERTGGASDGAILARLGGDELVLVDPAITDPAQATAIADRLLEAIGTGFQLRTHEIVVTASIGISLIQPDDETVDGVLQRADAAMYDAKAHDRNNARFYDRALIERARHYVDTESALRQAIDRDQLELHYQPKVHLESGRLVGVEALLRWRHPERGLVSPADFIPVAEESNLIVDLGRWVLQETCRRAVEWSRDPVLEGVRIAINVSAKQLRDRSFLDEVKEIMAETGAEPSSLEFELTERTLMNDTKVGCAILDELKAMGISTALDDFGTGYSSLSYLRLFTLDTLKIDRTFVRDVLTDKGSAAITRAVVAMGKQLGLCIVAEGVETQGQLEWLGALGCDEIQGFYFSPALTAEKLREWSERHVAKPRPRRDSGARLSLVPAPPSRRVA